MGNPEAVIQRTENILQKDREQTIIYQILSNMNPTKTQGDLRYPGMVGSSCFTRATRRVSLVTVNVLSGSYDDRSLQLS